MDRLQTRIDDAFQTPLAPGVVARRVDHAAWRPAMRPVTQLAFGAGPLVRLRHPGTEQDKILDAERSNAFQAVRRRVSLLVEADGQTIGGTWGQEDRPHQFYMVFTAIHPDWQGRGLYGALLRRLLGALEQAGFRKVWSRHQAHNNGVIVPKLKAGFVIRGLELSPQWGLLLSLEYPFWDDERRILAYRVDASPSHGALVRDGVVQTPEGDAG